jgi:hypothetical protein
MIEHAQDNADDEPHLARMAAGDGSSAGTHGGVVRFVDDVVTLAELQGNLAVLNGKEALRKATFPSGVLLFCFMFIASSVPVALLGVASLLAAALGIAQGWALLATAGMTCALAGPAAVYAMARLRRCLDGFRASREELSRNLAWLHTVLDGPAHESPRRPP